LTPSGENAAADGDTTRDSARLQSGPVEKDAERDALLPRPAAASEPTDAEIERGILDALARGLDGVAKALAARLDERLSLSARARRGSR